MKQRKTNKKHLLYLVPSLALLVMAPGARGTPEGTLAKADFSCASGGALYRELPLSERIACLRNDLAKFRKEKLPALDIERIRQRLNSLMRREKD